MKLLGLDLIAFGPFTGAALDLSEGAEGLHLLYGPNEAGKSSALRAVRQIFTGIPHLSNDNFLHKNDKLRLGARVRDARGEVFEFRRRKGRSKTLLDTADATIDDACLDAFLAGLKPDEFATKFAIDHDELVAGGKAVIAGGGDIGQLLFVAGTSLVGLAGVQKRLEDECEELFKRGGSKPRINATWSELEAARKTKNESVLRGSEWLEHVEALRHARESKRTVEGNMDVARSALRRLKRFEQALEPIARRRQLRDELAPLADAVLVPIDFPIRRREAISILQPAEIAEREALGNLEEIELELKALHVPEPLLEQAETIEQLHLRLGSHQQSARDRARLTIEAEQLDAEADTIRRDLGLEREQAEARAGLADRPLTVDERALIQDLGNERQVEFKAREDARKGLEKHAAKLAEATAKFEALGAVRDAAGLRKAIAQAQRQGDLEESVRVDREALERDGRKAEIDLATLGLWSGTLEQVERLAVPSAETIERFQGELDDASRAIDDLLTRIDQLDAQGREINAQVEQLRLEREVPTEDDLNLSRQHRQESWTHLKQAWDTGPDGTAASTFEQSVTAADEVADRLRREADRVATKTKLLAERGRCAQALADHRGRLAEAQVRLEEARGRWSALWEPSGIAPLSPREILAWVRKQGELATLARAIGEKRLALLQRVAKIAQHGGELGEAIEALGGSPRTPDEPLIQLIERGQELLDALAETTAARKRLEKELAALEAERPGLEERAASTDADLARWRSQWASAMLRLGLPEDASASQANAVVSKVTELFDRTDKVRAQRRRIESIDHESAQFSSDTQALAARVAPDLADLPNEQAAAELSARLTRARAASQRKAALVERREQTVAAIRNARAKILEMKARLSALCREARCDREESLPEVEERSAQRRKIEAELEDLNRQLSRLVGGEPLDAFVEEAEAKDPDALALEIARHDAEIKQLDGERETHDQAIGREEEILKHMDGSPRAADADQDAESLRARIRSDVEQYTRLRLASAVLREGIERYRQKRQGPILARAGTLFQTLTLGSFERLAVDYNEKDEPVLKGVRANGETVGVEGMSLGTADQLYLAVRLASLETYLDKGEPVPFVIDDILIQFDDDRAAAALGVLADLSRRTQVLLFTHHRRVVELAKSRLDPSILFTHALPARG